MARGRISTSAKAVVPHIDRIFSQFGFPETIKTDGGPPFNGLESHPFKQYMQWAGVKHRVVSPEDPEANGLAENFMKAIGKVYHIAKIEGKNYRQEIYKFLRSYRNTPHSTTGMAPAEVMFGRTMRTRLPETSGPTEELAHESDKDMRMNDQNAKTKQKSYKDQKSNVKPHDIHIGDRVILLQKKDKSNPQYDPRPYSVTKVNGTQITAARGMKVRTRDAKKFKRVANSGGPNDYSKARYPLALHGTEWETDVSGLDPGNRPQPAVAREDMRRNDNQGVPNDIQREPLAPNNNQVNQPDNAPIQAQRGPTRQHQYPNGHLEPAPNPGLQREARHRAPPKVYDARSGAWQEP